MPLADRPSRIDRRAHPIQTGRLCSEANRTNQNLTLVDTDDLGKAIVEHYDRMGSADDVLHLRLEGRPFP